MCNFLGIEVKVTGQIKDKNTFFIVSNHLSYTDIPVIASIFDCVFVSKEEVKNWPIIGLFSRIVGTIFVNRNSKKSTLEAIKDSEKVLNSHRSIVLFPEATTSDGSSVREFKSAFFSLPEKMEKPILPIAISYKNKITGLRDITVPWYDNTNMLTHFWHLIGNKGIIAEVIYCEVIKPHEIQQNCCSQKNITTEAQNHKEHPQNKKQIVEEAFSDNFSDSLRICGEKNQQSIRKELARLSWIRVLEAYMNSIRRP
ncbi:MAG: 1-acyl-sn-glycerol-3-phosphate acyltransferase [Thermodesulfovibrionales bacterium]|nr:1-acyl-sn-glycerol-3-phosphate acyltransferase [Thermodesulfovibrionales bacterium]